MALLSLRGLGVGRMTGKRRSVGCERGCLMKSLSPWGGLAALYMAAA